MSPAPGGPPGRPMIPRGRARHPGPPQPSTTSRSRGASLRTIGPVVAAHDDVLDPGAVPPLEVDARLDAERHARRERLGVARDQVRLLVPFEADAMPGPVDEPLAVARAVDDAARDRVDRARTRRPAGRAAVASACASLEDVVEAAGTRRPVPFAGSPPVTQTVRVMSEP